MAAKRFLKTTAVCLAALCLAPITSCRVRGAGTGKAVSSAPTESGFQEKTPSSGGRAASSSEAGVFQPSAAAWIPVGGTSAAPSGISSGVSAGAGKDSRPERADERIVTAAPRNYVFPAVIEGVNGWFGDPEIKETIRNLAGKTYILATARPEMFNGSGTTPDDKLGAKAVSSIQKDYHCKFQIKPLDTSGKEILADKASGVLYADILDCDAADANPNFIFNTAANLRGIKTVNIDGGGWNPVQTLTASFNGKTYGAGFRFDWIERELLYFNTGLAQKYNLGNLFSYASNGTWTDDMFRTVCQTFKKDAGDGFNACEATGPSRLFDLVYTNWTSPLAYKNSKYVFFGSDNSVVSMLTYLKNFVRSGLFNKQYAESDRKDDGTFTDSEKDVSAAVADFEAGKTLFLIGSDSLLPNLSVSKMFYSLLPLPKGPLSGSNSSVVTNCWYFSLFEGTANRENSGALLTALASRTNVKTSDIVNFNMTLVRDQNSLNRLSYQYQNKQIIDIRLSRANHLAGLFNNAAVAAVIDGTYLPKQAMDSISAKAQAGINKDCGQ